MMRFLCVPLGVLLWLLRLPKLMDMMWQLLENEQLLELLWLNGSLRRSALKPVVSRATSDLSIIFGLVTFLSQFRITNN